MLQFQILLSFDLSSSVAFLDKNVCDMKCVYRAFFQFLSGKFLSPRGIQRGSITNFRWFQWEAHSEFLEFSWQNLVKFHNKELKKIQSSESCGCSLRTEGLTDRHDDANV